MSNVVVTPVTSGPTPPGFCAISTRSTAFGASVGQAIDALHSPYVPGHESHIIVLSHPDPDQYFTAGQQARLTDLMAKWRSARDGGSAFSKVEREELESLVREETAASGRRAADIRNRIGS